VEERDGIRSSGEVELASGIVDGVPDAFSDVTFLGSERGLSERLDGLVTVLCRSLESLKLVQGDRRDDQAQ
jgi:hypothetical protein